MEGGFIKKIAIVGPESTGKSELARELAAHFHTEWVPEYAREYLRSIDRPYESWDLPLIAQGQLQSEHRLAKMANGYLFCDTNLLVIKIWSEFRYGQCHPDILKNMQLESYTFHLLTQVDLPWTPDPLREHPHARKELFNLYHQALKDSGLPFGIVSGTGEKRIRHALDLMGPVMGLI